MGDIVGPPESAAGTGFDWSGLLNNVIRSGTQIGTAAIGARRDIGVAQATPYIVSRGGGYADSAGVGVSAGGGGVSLRANTQLVLVGALVLLLLMRR
jgi:hypothetical protein